MVPFLILLIAGVAAIACYFFISLKQSRAAMEELRLKAASVLDVVAEREQVQQEKARIQLDRQKASAETASLEARLRLLRSEEAALEESAELREFGFYKPRYDFQDAARYAAELERVRSKQKAMIQAKTAAVGQIAWTVNGSAAEGRKQIGQTLRLLLRAFNGECDASIARVKYNNVTTMETRIRKAYEAINKLADVQKCVIAPEYLNLKMSELHLPQAALRLTPMTDEHMTDEQLLAAMRLNSTRLDLGAARVAYEVAPVNLDVARLLAQAVRAEEQATKTYMAAMTAGLAAEISDIVPDAFQD